MVEVNKAQRLASTRPKFGVNEVKIWGHSGLKLGVNKAQRLGSMKHKLWGQ